MSKPFKPPRFDPFDWAEYQLSNERCRAEYDRAKSVRQGGTHGLRALPRDLPFVLHVYEHETVPW